MQALSLNTGMVSDHHGLKVLLWQLIGPMWWNCFCVGPTDLGSMITIRKREGRVAYLAVPVILCWLLAWIYGLALCSCWQVSNRGRVKNTRGKISHGHLHSSGYQRVTIRSETGRRNFYVHRLVAFAFHGEPSSPLLVVNHIDGNRKNNAGYNLEYVTQSENVRHALTMSKWKGGRSKTVRARWLGASVWQIFSSVQQAADAVGVSANSVSKCCNGKLRSCHGHEFQFEKEADLQGEVWKDAMDPTTRSALPGYRISSCGRIEGPTGIRRYGRCNRGYRRICCKGRELLVHRIMASTFLDLPVSDKAPWEVNHLDGNRSNNSVENLEVVNRSENVLHAWQMRASRDVISNRMPVEGLHLQTGAKFSFASVTEAARHVSQANESSIAEMCGISACCKGRRQNFSGHEWCYSFESDAQERPDEVWKDVDIPGLMAAWNVSR